MTREEAIDVLKHNYPSSCYEDLCKAVDMAIEVLEQPEQLQDKCEGCYYKNGMGYQCDSCARYFPDRYTSEREE